MAIAAGSVDAPGQARWLAIANAIVSHFTGGQFQPGTLVAAGSAVSGRGSPLSVSLVPSLLVGPAGSVDAPGVAAWTAIGSALQSFINGNAQVVPSAFVASPTGGPVTGAGTVGFASSALGPVLATAAGSVDAPGIAAWTAIAAAVLNHFTTNGVVASAYASPNGGGALTGEGTLS